MFPPSEEIPATEISASLNSPSKPPTALSPSTCAIDQLNLNSSQQPALLNLKEIIGDAEEPIYRSPRKVVRTFALDFEGLKERKSIDDLVELGEKKATEGIEHNESTVEPAVAESSTISIQSAPIQAASEATFEHSFSLPVAVDSPITAKHKSDEDLSSQQPLHKRAALFTESDQEEREILSQNIDTADDFYQSQPVQFQTQADEESPSKQKTTPSSMQNLSVEFENKIASISVSPQKSPIKSRVMSPIRMPIEAEVKSPLHKEDKSAKQIEFLQYEISSLQSKYQETLAENAELRSVTAEYERTLAQFLGARRSHPDQFSSVEELVREKKKLELEIQSVQVSFQNLHQRYEDIKGLHEQTRINEATLKQSVQLLQQELAASVRNLDSTRKSYEERLEKANMESLNLKSSLENELSVTKAKLLKSELIINSLEATVESKTKENAELLTICDELIHKMDRKP